MLDYKYRIDHIKEAQMRGRPKEPNAQRAWLALRLKDAQYAAVVAAAQTERVTVSDFVRRLLPSPTNPAPSVESVAG